MQGMFPVEQVAAAMQRAGLGEHTTAMDTGEVKFVDLYRELLQGPVDPPDETDAGAEAEPELEPDPELPSTV